MIKNYKSKIYLKNFLSAMILLIVFSCSIFISHTAFAEGYAPLAPIPGFVEETVSDNDLNGYLNGMFKLGIALAVGLAVVMIIIGGIQYMSTDAGDGGEGLVLSIRDVSGAEKNYR